VRGLALASLESELHLNKSAAHFNRQALCLATLGKPVRAATLAAWGVLRADSARLDEHIWAWPLREIEPLQPPLPATGA
jgi:hypothetical protein